MKRTVKQKYQEMDVATLKKEINSNRLALTEAKLKLHSGQLKDTSVFKKTRSLIAYLLNLIYRHEQQR